MPVEHELSRLFHRKYILSKRGKGFRVVAFTQFPPWQCIIAKSLLHAGVIHKTVLIIAGNDLIVGRIEHHLPAGLQQIDAETVVIVTQSQ